MKSMKPEASFFIPKITVGHKKTYQLTGTTASVWASETVAMGAGSEPLFRIRSKH